MKSVHAGRPLRLTLQATVLTAVLMQVPCPGKCESLAEVEKQGHDLVRDKQYSRAERLYRDFLSRQAVHGDRAARGDKRSIVLKLTLVLLLQKRLEDAEPGFREIMESKVSKEDLEFIANLNQLSVAYLDYPFRSNRERILCLSHSIALMEQVSTSHPRMLKTMNSLVNLQLKRKDFKALKSTLERYLKVAERNHVNDSPVWLNRLRLACVLDKEGHHEQARALMENARLKCANQAEYLRLLAKASEYFLPASTVEQMYLNSLKSARKVSNRGQIAANLDALAAFYRNSKKHAQAAQVYRELIQLHDKDPGVTTANGMEAVYCNYAYCLKKLGRESEANNYQNKGMNLRRKRRIEEWPVLETKQRKAP